MRQSFLEAQRVTLESARERVRLDLQQGVSPTLALERLTDAVDRIVGACDAFLRLELGDPSVAYALLAAGSYARREISPYSDLDYAILIERDTPKTRAYFTRYAERLERLIEEIDGEGRLHTCDLLSPAGTVGEAFLDTPEKLAGRAAGLSKDLAERSGRDRDYIQTSLSATRTIAGVGEPRLGAAFTEALERRLGPSWPQIAPDGTRRALLDQILRSLRDPFGLPEEIPGWPKSNHAPLSPDEAIASGKVNVKHDLMKALQIPLFALRVLHGISETGGAAVFDALEQREVIDPAFARKLKETHHALLQIRVLNHVAVGKSDDRLAEMSPSDRRAIRRMVPLLFRLRQSLELLRTADPNRLVLK